MPPQPLLAIIQQLRSSGFRGVPGARLTAVVPIPETFVNELVAALKPPDAPVREVSIRPESGDRLSVRITPRTGFLPPITLKLDIVRQPEFPASPLLVLKMATMPGLFSLAGAAFPVAQMLPPGVRLQGEQILVDLQALAAQHQAEDLLALVRQLQLTTEPGRLVVFVEAGT